MFGLFNQIVKTAVRTATLPVDVVKDACTFGGLNTGQDEPYTWAKLKQLAQDIDDIPDSIDD